jgi:hypothetical protein
MMDFVSWDDEIPNLWKIKNVPNHQPDHHKNNANRKHHDQPWEEIIIPYVQTSSNNPMQGGVPVL